MKNLITKAKELVTERGLRPGMYAATKESYVNMICTIMEMLELDFNGQDFYVKHLGTYGNTYLGAFDDVDKEWGASVAQDALRMIEEHEQGKKEV